jgi:hypothetical protein
MARILYPFLVLLLVATAALANGWLLIASVIVGGLAFGALGAKLKLPKERLIADFLAVGLTFGAIKAAVRLGNAMAYPPIVILDGCWFAAVFVATAALGALAVASPRPSPPP